MESNGSGVKINENLHWDLDKMCFDHARELEAVLQEEKIAGKDSDKAVTSALGVLQEDGLFAYFVYLEHRKGKKKGGEQNDDDAKNDSKDDKQNKKKDGEKLTYSQLSEYSQGLLDTILKRKKKEDDDWKDVVNDAAQDIDNLLFTVMLVERFLIYARYLAKGRG